MGVRKCFTLGPVVHHQEPAAHPLFRRMHRVACDCLLDLRQQRLRVAHEQIAHVLAVLEFILQQLDGTADRMTLELHNATVKGDATIHGGEQAKRTLAADIRGLDRRAIFQHGQQRQHGTLRKIGVLEQASGVADHIAKLERDRLKMGIYSLAAGGLQRAQQSIAPQIMVRLHSGHGFMSFRCRFLRNPDNGHVDGTAWDRDRHFRTLSTSESEQKRSFTGVGLPRFD